MAAVAHESKPLPCGVEKGGKIRETREDAENRAERSLLFSCCLLAVSCWLQNIRRSGSLFSVIEYTTYSL
jgi:hypothetical protein